MKLNRRHFLKGISASAMSAASLSTITTGLTSFSTHAQSSDDYKALVCVFLYGGMDNHDFILPYDMPSYTRFANIRSSMMSHRDHSSLLPISPLNTSEFSGREFALPAQMPNLQTLFNSGNAAIVGNVGPLVAPTSLEQFDNQSVSLPPRLFSHNDQQAIWQASAPEGAQFGWGGLFADAQSFQNTSAEFTNVSTDGSGLFLTGNNTSPYQITADGANNINLLDIVESNSGRGPLFERLSAHFRNSNRSYQNIIQQDVAGIMGNAFTTNETYNQSRQNIVNLATSFNGDGLSSQLKTVAEAMSIRDYLGVKRQVFFVTMGGFDTHNEQETTLPGLQYALDNAIYSFQQAMIELGLSEQVTLFTASDFGRTLAVNGDGTDHGWGAHQVVVGGAVQGQRIYGDIPPADFGHAWDVGRGRLLPSTSVEQMAAPLGKWFGLDDNQLNQALPNLANFPAPLLSFI